MHIQINTDHKLVVHTAFADELRLLVENGLAHCSEHITRVEVHLSEEHDSRRCLLEARLEGRQPLAVSESGQSLQQAVGGAAGKLSRLISHTLGRATRATDADLP